jgi:hypothetical protein
MLTLTLDTSCVIHAVRRQRQAESMDSLMDLARDGRVTLWLTSAFDRDQERAAPENAEANRRWIETSPIRGVVPGPARLDYSAWDGPDVLVDDDFGPVDEALRRILLPAHLAPEQVGPDTVLTEADVRNMHDVQHLGAHRLSGHDAFVTEDHRDILRRGEEITRQTGIVVWTLAQAVEEVRQQA